MQNLILITSSFASLGAALLMWYIFLLALTHGGQVTLVTDGILGWREIALDAISILVLTVLSMLSIIVLLRDK